jgi:hypothetical protein
MQIIPLQAVPNQSVEASVRQPVAGANVRA